MKMVEKIIILGSGPAGYTAAIYAARAGLSPLMIEGAEPGGQLMTTTDVDNYPGFPNGVQWPEMMQMFRDQAVRFDTRIENAWVTDVDFSKKPYALKVDGKEFEAHTVVIATGAEASWLGLENEQKLRGHGVSACATCDAFFYKGANLIVVGGGDTAMEETIVLSKVAKHVDVIQRRDKLRASKAMQDRVMALPNVGIIWDSVLEDVKDPTQNKVTHAVIKNVKTGEITEKEVEGIFIAIGHKPNTGPFEGKLEMDENGYLKVTPGTTKTNVDGVFAVGDVADPLYRQAITAAGTGCMGALDALRYLEENGLAD
jgi:thioredoxin reductase (NADPH)